MKNAGTQRNVLTQTTGQEEQLLVEHDEYVVSLARKKVPRGRIHPDNVGDDIDELAQRIRIKLWLIARKQEITAARADARPSGFRGTGDRAPRAPTTLSPGVGVTCLPIGV